MDRCVLFEAEPLQVHEEDSNVLQWPSRLAEGWFEVVLPAQARRHVGAKQNAF